MGQTVVIGTRSSLVLLLQLKKFFKRSSNYVLITPINFFSKGIPIFLNIQIKIIHKEYTPVTKLRLERLQLLNPLIFLIISSSNSSRKFNSHSMILVRSRCKMLPMASLITQTEHRNLCLKEYLGVFRDLRSLIGHRRFVIYFMDIVN